jgi:hypothetical protein
MTLARRGSRRIRINDEVYRWTLSADDEPGLGVVVEAADAPAQRMVTWFNHGCIITPAVVRHCVVAALADGWRPRERGPELRYRVRSGVTERPERF